MPPQKPQDQQVQDAMHNPESQINLPHRSKAKTVWMIIAIISIIALIAVSAFSYYKWRQYRTLVGDLGARINALENQANDLNAQLAAQTTSKTSNSSQYLKITQWGVELIPGSSLTDLQYTLKSADVSQFQSPSMNQKLNTNATAAEACGAGTLGAIARGKAGQAFLGTTYDKATGAVKVGDYYYVYQQPGSGCGGSGADLSTLQKGWLEMANSMKTLRATP